MLRFRAAIIDGLRPIPPSARITLVQEESQQHERMVRIRVPVDDVNRRALINLADARDLQEQMREITARLGNSIMKVGADELKGPPPDQQ
jgi:hypothetical protein